MSGKPSINVHIGEHGHGHDHSHGHGHGHDDFYARHHEWLGKTLADSSRQARWLLIVAVILLALTAQNFRENFFGFTRPIPQEYAGESASFCNTTDFLKSCENPLIFGSTAGTAWACVEFQGQTNFVSGGQCSCSYAAANEGASCSSDGSFICHQGTCVSKSDPSLGVTCPVDGNSCQLSGSARVVNGECVFEADNSKNGQGCGEQPALNACYNGQCISKTSREVTAYAYDTSISSGIIASALAVEVLLTGSFTPDLAALSITAGLVNLGWTAKSRDVGNYPNNDALIRTQNAFVFIVAAFAFLWGGKLLLKKGNEKKDGGLNVIALIIVIIGTVQFGLAAQLFDSHFQRTAEGQIDGDANIAFNWSYNATIYAAMVNVALAVTIFLTGTYCAGFVLFSAFTGLVALAFASRHRDFGAVDGQDFSSSLLAWVSFAIIAAAFSVIIGFYLILKSAPGNESRRLGNNHLGVAAIALIAFFTLIGLVAALFEFQFFDKSNFSGGDNFNAVSNANYGNAVSPFAWPVSVWSSCVGVAFTLGTLVKKAPSGGIAALALTESANLVGWAANHVYFGSVKNESIQGLARAWGAIALSVGLITFFLAFGVLTGGQKQDKVPQDDPHAEEFTTQ